MEQQRSDRDLSAAEIITWAGWHEIQKGIGPCFAHLEQRQRVRRYVATSLRRGIARPRRAQEQLAIGRARWRDAPPTACNGC